MANNPVNKTACVREGAMRMAAAAAVGEHGRNAGVAELAIGALRKFVAFRTSYKQVCVDSGGVPALVAALKTHMNNMFVVHYSCATLADLLCSPSTTRATTTTKVEEGFGTKDEVGAGAGAGAGVAAGVGASLEQRLAVWEQAGRARLGELALRALKVHGDDDVRCALANVEVRRLLGAIGELTSGARTQHHHHHHHHHQQQQQQLKLRY